MIEVDTDGGHSRGRRTEEHACSRWPSQKITDRRWSSSGDARGQGRRVV
jgi:hypothetical protein